MTVGSCEVCSKRNHRYKCPQCLLKYCSLPCYKTHKGQRCDRLIDTRKDGQIEPVNIMANDVSLSGALTEDSVPLERLKDLEGSLPLKEMLENAHLRQILKDLSTSTNPAKQIESMMKEPLFLEFVEECLQTVEPVCDDDQ